MNISSINTNEKVSQNFMAKFPKSRIHCENELDTSIKNWLDKNQQNLEKYIDLYDAPLIIAQRKSGNANALFANTGAITLRLDLNKILHEKDIMSFFRDVFEYNSKVKTEGLSKSLNAIF